MFAAASLQETYSSFSASNPTSVENKTRFSKSQSPLRVGQSQIRALCKGLIPGFLLLHSDVSTTCLENLRRETFPGNLGCHRSFGAVWAVGWLCSCPLADRKLSTAGIQVTMVMWGEKKQDLEVLAVPEHQASASKRAAGSLLPFDVSTHIRWSFCGICIHILDLTPGCSWLWAWWPKEWFSECFLSRFC